MQVHTDGQADFQFGLLQRKYRSDPTMLAALELAYHSIVIELRTGLPYIFHMGSSLDPDAYSLDHPPLTAHFYKVSDTKLSIFAFKEQGS